MEDGFIHACNVEADLSNLSGSLKKLSGSLGDYWKLEYDIGILFGSNEFKALLFWKDGNVRVHAAFTPFL
jgi:hypothetical protein